MNKLQEKITKKQNILGAEVVGVDGCSAPYRGTIRELSVYDHKILGRMVQVWVEWEREGYPKGHLEGYSPSQFKEWDNQRAMGVYYV